MNNHKRLLIATITTISCIFLHTGCTYDWPVSDSGTCGPNLQWTFDYETATVNITGTGPMNNYEENLEYYQEKHSPWEGRPVKTVIFSEDMTSIGSYAFHECKKLSSITIPANVSEIGEGAFYRTSLVSVTCCATNPPTIENDSFSSDYSDRILYVPASCVSKYKNNQKWDESFSKILPID